MLKFQTRKILTNPRKKQVNTAIFRASKFRLNKIERQNYQVISSLVFQV